MSGVSSATLDTPLAPPLVSEWFYLNWHSHAPFEQTDSLAKEKLTIKVQLICKSAELIYM